MMARSTTRSNQRPDTLMQDRRRQFDEIFLQRAAGPYIGVKSAVLTVRPPLPVYPKLRSQTPNWEVSFTPNSRHSLMPFACLKCAIFGSCRPYSITLWRGDHRRWKAWLKRVGCLEVDASGSTAVNSRHRTGPRLTRMKCDCADNNGYRSAVNR
jgi:hypothetical protein